MDDRCKSFNYNDCNEKCELNLATRREHPEDFNATQGSVYFDADEDTPLYSMRRQDGSVDFWRNWDEYQSGFGDLSGEFWLGNDNLVTLTSDDLQGTWELQVDLGDWENNTVWAKYTDFKLSPGEYRLNYDCYDMKSTAGDSMRISKGFPFTTKDKDNDVYGRNCARIHKGAWWFNACMECHLNGIYYPEKIPGIDWGIYWWHWKKLSVTP
ncbi:angiopoietin-related protein 1-like [Patiria miniata]|uniref:Fibrinogen C-terminal domain-containing protein n=1 Tax=Patiria miniata TaxID=46514 RepID=A0A913ZQD6_PATMI|nr:angiopoietin-related protein 1-like [Patiria miniata]